MQMLEGCWAFLHYPPTHMRRSITVWEINTFYLQGGLSERNDYSLIFSGPCETLNWDLDTELRHMLLLILL
ncbi:hypothetical protein K1719_019823 [Acacia pycnantha]|nr:hypothetical protein K1719_019823 [Acacia pycnantha]